MKTKKLLLLLALASFAMTGWAGPMLFDCDSIITVNQNGVITVKHLYEKQSSQYDLLVYDWRWDSNKNLLTRTGKNEYRSDEKGNQTLYAFYYWLNDTWEGMTKDEYEYNEQGNKTLNISYSWENEEWVISGKGELTYNTNGKLTFINRYSWDKELNDWRHWQKEEYKYDTQGNLTEKSGENMYRGNTYWTPAPKTGYEYNAQGQLIRENNYSVSYNNSGGQISNIKYGNNVKYEYGYDAQGNQTSKTEYKWSSNAWGLSSRNLYTYDAKGIKKHEEYHGDKEFLTGYIEGSYPPVPIYTVLQDAFISSADYGYDTQNRIKTAKTTSYGYKLIGNNQYVVDNEATTVETATYYYNDETTGIISAKAEDGIKLYPNPVKDELRVESGELRVENVKILDLSGKTVFLPSCGGVGGGFSINVSHLSSGIYLLKIETDKGSITEKFVKE